MTTTLIEKITDTSTMVTFTTTYAVSIPAKVGGSTAFVGFTGGTGGLTATQDVQTWTLRSTPLVILFDCCSPGQTGMSASVW